MLNLFRSNILPNFKALPLHPCSIHLGTCLKLNIFKWIKKYFKILKYILLKFYFTNIALMAVCSRLTSFRRCKQRNKRHAWKQDEWKQDAEEIVIFGHFVQDKYLFNNKFLFLFFLDWINQIYLTRKFKTYK